MATITINGQEHALPEGERLNAIQAALRFGVEIPYYCWHPALSVVANCRMCEVEVGTRDCLREQHRASLVDGDAQVFDLVEREVQARRETGCRRPKH